MKTNRFFWILLISASCLTGVLFYLKQQGMLIVLWSSRPAISTLSSLQKNIVIRKKVFLYFCKTTTFEHASVEILWAQDNHQENLNNLIGNWITQLQEEKIISRYVTLESVAYSSLSREGIISFSQSPLEPQWSIMQKWYCLESLGKTIKEAGIPITSLIFLVNNQPMEDDHLDISHPWPLDGFINSSR